MSSPKSTPGGLYYSSIKRRAEDLLTQLSTLPSIREYQNLRHPPNLLIAQELRDIDRIIRSAHSRLHELQNLLAPVNTLPPELLTYIFGLHLSSPWDRVEGFNPSLSLRILMNQHCQIYSMTHVCRYWRNAALADGSLWNSFTVRPIDLNNIDSLAVTCLDRSSDVPLDVQVTPYEYNSQLLESTWRVLTFDIGRLRRLHIKYIPARDGIDHGGFAQFDEAAPLLQALKIDYDDYYARFYASQNNRSKLNLPTLFDGNTPRLQHLEIRTFISYSKNRFQNLASLRLFSQDYQLLSEMDRLFQLLEASPMLKEVVFRWCTLPASTVMDPPEYSTTKRIVVLSSLRHLDLHDCSEGFMRCLLAHLELPRDHFTFSCRDPQFVLANGLLETVTAPLAPLTSLQLIYNKRVEIKAVGSCNVIYIEASEPLYPPDADGLDALSRPIIASPSRLFALRALTELKLAGIDSNTSSEWYAFFTEMTALKRVVFYLPPQIPLKWFAALTPSVIEPSQGAQLQCPAPRLSELCIWPFIPTAWPKICSMVNARAHAGHPLQLLRIGTLQQDKFHVDGTEVIFETGYVGAMTGVPEANKSYMTREQSREWT